VAARKGKPIDAIVEQVLNGSTVRARLLLSQQEHQFVLVQMAGVRSPRAKSITSREGDQGNQGEEWGDEVYIPCAFLLVPYCSETDKPSTRPASSVTVVCCSDRCRSFLSPSHLT
jgi:hypothetical protein